MSRSKVATIEQQIHECQSELNFLGPQYSASRKLIISTGDISDIDGFFALAQYATTGADVLFIMNYPAYFGFEKDRSEDDDDALGLGFGFSASFYLKYSNILLGTTASSDDVEKFKHYNELLNTYTPRNIKTDEGFKRALTVLAFSMAKQVWDSSDNPDKGTLHFCIGGINEINPFGHRILKNEAFVYASVMEYDTGLGKVLSLRQRESLTSDTRVVDNCLDLLNRRDSIYIDFNGSMAFLDSFWEEKLCKFKDVIKGVFVLGGVLADVPPQTMSSVKGVLNRLSCATMNQLYAPTRTASFLSLMGSCGIPIYVVPNNAVGDLLDRSATRLSSPWEAFLKANGLNIPILNKMAGLFYNSRYNPPVKAFDFYNALALTHFMDGVNLPYTEGNFFFDDVYGVSLISSLDEWSEVVSAYGESMKRSERYIKNSDSFDKEALLLATLKPKNVRVFVLKFSGHPSKIDIV